MSVVVCDAELFGVTETSLTLFFRVEDGSGPVDAPVRILLDGECRAVSEGPAGMRMVRLEGLDPDTEYRLEIRTAGGSLAEPDSYLPSQVRTHPAPGDPPTACFATVNDLHFGEPRFGGVLSEDHEYGDEAPGFPLVREEDTEVPYWRFMNEDAIREINASGADLAIVKGDIADRGLPEQFDLAAKAFGEFAMPHHAFLGNHDYYGWRWGQEVDGYALLGQEPAPRTLDLGGWRLVLLETSEPGEHRGVFSEDRLGWLDRTLQETRELRMPTLLLMHHHPVPPEHAHSYPNTIGIHPEHSLRLFDVVGAHPQVRGVLIGHTHRNRVRRYPASGRTPFAEVHCTKDYPGGWAHYRLYPDGSFRQEVRRTSSPRALEHSSRARHCFRGLYRDFALGTLDARSFVVGP